MKKIKLSEKLLEEIKRHDIGEILVEDDTLCHIAVFQYDAGELICKMGQVSKYIYFILSGACKVSPISAEGKKMQLQILRSNDFCGEIEYFTENNMEYMFDVEVASDTKIIAIPYTYIDKVLRQDKRFMDYMCKKLCEKVKKNAQGYSGAFIYNAKERTIRYIAELSAGNKKIIFKSTEAALKLGISERHLRRIIQELINEGSISKSYKFIVILEPEKFLLPEDI